MDLKILAGVVLLMALAWQFSRPVIIESAPLSIHLDCNELQKPNIDANITERIDYASGICGIYCRQRNSYGTRTITGHKVICSNDELMCVCRIPTYDPFNLPPG